MPESGVLNSTAAVIPIKSNAIYTGEEVLVMLVAAKEVTGEESLKPMEIL